MMVVCVCIHGYVFNFYGKVFRCLLCAGHFFYISIILKCFQIFKVIFLSNLNVDNYFCILEKRWHFGVKVIM